MYDFNILKHKVLFGPNCYTSQDNTDLLACPVLSRTNLYLITGFFIKDNTLHSSVQFNSVQLLSRVQLFVTP